jgi:hypothetical protein
VSFGPGPANRTGGRSPSPYRRTPDRPTTPRCYECGSLATLPRTAPRGRTGEPLMRRQTRPSPACARARGRWIRR